MYYSFNTFRNAHRFRALSSLKRVLCTTCGKNNFTPVYKFPYIRAASLVNRLKLYQTGITAASIPGSILMCSFGVISADSVIITFILGVTATLSFFLMGIVPNKLVGFVYISDDNKIVKLAYVNFWGKRSDVELPLSDLVPLSDLPAVPTDPLYLTLRRFSSPETFKINLKYGIVLEKNKFNTVFLQEL